MWSSKVPFKCLIEYLQVQLIEHVFVREGEDVDMVLWDREKYGQAQLFTLTQELNNMNEWYALNRRSYRRWLLKIISCFIVATSFPYFTIL